MSVFRQAVEWVLEHEGGYVNDPADPGGETKYGISSRSYPDLDIESLTRDEAIEIYRRDWWQKYEYDRIRPPKLAVKVFDMAVNMGPTTAHRLLQKALVAAFEPVKVDGIIGPKTLGAVDVVDPDDLMCALVTLSVEHYDQLVKRNPRLERFWQGWMNRAQAIPPEIEIEEDEKMLSGLAKISGIARTVYDVVMFLLSLLRGIKEIVKLVEEEGPENGGGECKKELALEIIGAIYDTLSEIAELPVSRERVMAFSNTIIDALVSFYNAINFFRKDRGGED